MPGFISNKVLRPTKDGDPYIVLTLWETEKDFKGWIKSDEFKEGHAKQGRLPKEAYFQKNEIEMHEVFLDSDSA